MAISFASLNDIEFSSNFQLLTIIADGQSSVTFSLSTNGTVIFANTYTPNANGYVYIYDLHKLLDEAIDQAHASFTFKVGQTSKDVTVIRCNTLVDIPASDFINKYFLSPLMATRRTSRYRKECLSLIADTSTSIDAFVTYYKNGSLNTITKHLDDVTGFATIDASPSRFFNEQEGQLVSYRITAGPRSQDFDVVTYNPDAVSVIYRNSFHVFDTFHFNGLIATEFEHTRSNAVVGGQLVNYDIKQTKLFKANTGVIPFGMEVLPYEVCRSMELYLLEDDSFGDEIVITDAEIKSDNAPDTINDFTITYRRANSFTTKIKTPKAVKLFDSTFDGTFN